MTDRGPTCESDINTDPKQEVFSCVLLSVLVNMFGFKVSLFVSVCVFGDLPLESIVPLDSTRLGAVKTSDENKIVFITSYNKYIFLQVLFLLATIIGMVFGSPFPYETDQETAASGKRTF